MLLCPDAYLTTGASGKDCTWGEKKKKLLEKLAVCLSGLSTLSNNEYNVLTFVI